MKDTYLLERIVSGEMSPDNLPERYKIQTYGFRGDPNRMDALHGLMDIDYTRAYNSLVEWVKQLGEGTAPMHWTTCTDTLNILTNYVDGSVQPPESMEEVIPALEKITRAYAVSEHDGYQYTAIDLIRKIAKLNEAHVDNAREALENIRDDKGVSFSKRVYARRVLAQDSEDFERFWGRYSGQMIDFTGHTKHKLQDVGMAIASKRIGEDQFRDVCFVVSVTSHNEFEQMSDDELRVKLGRLDVVEDARELGMLIYGLGIIEEELETGNIYDHSWQEAARISNCDLTRLQERYRITIQTIKGMYGEHEK